MSATVATNWQIRPLRELLVAFESGSRPKGGVKGIETGVPSLGGEHLDSNGGFKFGKIKFVPKAFAQKMTRGRIQSEDILVVKDGATTGKTSFVGPSFPYPEAVINEHVFLCRCREGIDPKYVFYFLYSAEGNRQILEDFRGAAQGGISQRFAEIVNVPLAPLDQQKGIVAEIEKQFSRLDEAVANLKRVKANLKRYKAAVLKAAVEGHLVETEAEIARREGRDYETGEQLYAQGRANAAGAGSAGAALQYETGEQLLKRILETRRSQWKGKGKYKEPAAPDTTDLPELPDGWVWATVESLSMKVTDGVHKKPNYVAEGIPFVTVKNLTAGDGISFEELNYVTPEDHAEFCKRTHPERGDILISKDGTLGVVRLIETDRVFSVFVSVALVKPTSYDLSRYLVIAFESPVVQRQMVPKGSGLQHIHLEDLRADCIPVPPLAEQHRIVAEVDRRLSILRETENQVDANLVRAERLRQSILDGAFSGQIGHMGDSAVSGVTDQLLVSA